jgi:dipeptidase
MMPVVDWDSGKPLGNIPQVERTYAVVGNINEHQLSIGETTFTGREELLNPQGGIDYGSLMYITLQRAKTAREAISIMADLVEKHGYASTGETFSIADPTEVWMMDLIGKGPKRKGAVWVARRIPDGYVTAHANQSRIRQFPLNDPQNCLYAKDVIHFAREKGYFSGPDEAFSFSDAYSPMTFETLRTCEARVWSMFRRVAPSVKLPLDYIKGVQGAKPLPLWIKPDKKLGVMEMMGLMRDHFENTEFDLSRGIGAGPYGLPYRWRPLSWELKGKKFTNERATATQQTGFSFIAQMRSWLPAPIGGVLWFSVDDAASTVYVPMYCGMTQIPKSYAEKTADFSTFSWDSAFWVFNFVSNFAYSRYQDMIKDIQQVQGQLEGSFLANQAEIEKAALNLYRRSVPQATQFLTRYSVTQGQQTTARWRKLGEELLVKYLDGNVRDAKGKVTHPGYPQEWYGRIVKENGAHFELKRLKGEIDPEAEKAKKKKQATPLLNSQGTRSPCCSPPNPEG